MKKLFLIVLLAMLCNTYLLSQNNKPIITVLDFKTDGISQSEMSSIISLLSSALFKTELFTVIDVSQRQTVLNELEFSMSGCSDDSCMLEVGKLLSAEGIIVGSIGRVGSKYVFSAKMLETETGKTLSAADGVYTDLDELIGDVSTISSGLAIPFGGVAVETKAESEPTAVEPVVEAQVADGGVNIPAIATLSGGVVSIGVGTYFLITSLPLIFDYLSAKDAYDNETDTVLVAEKYNTFNIAWQAADDGNANTKFIIGASCAGVGIILTTISIIMFGSSGNDSQPSPQIALMPMPGAATLSFRLSY